MSNPWEYPEAFQQQALRAAREALVMVCANLPYLAGLAHTIQLKVDARVDTAGIFESGRLLIHPKWFLELNTADRTFVLAHELMHLTLRTHQRGQSRVFNIAHDYIINDLLSWELDCPVPAGGLEWEGAREKSAEELAHLIARGMSKGRAVSAPVTPSLLGEALAQAGLTDSPTPQSPADVLDVTIERLWFPDEEAQILNHQTLVLKAVAESTSAKVLQSLRTGFWGAGNGNHSGQESLCVEVLHSLYRPPWEAALQRWIEAVASGTRTFARPSRRGADRTDVVLPGHQHEGWILHLVLDTSGSMNSAFTRALENIAAFCLSANVQCVHIIQCDWGIAREEEISPEQLSRYMITGLGGSNLTPAMHQLANDPRVEAAIVITDGDIAFPTEAMPYEVLWVLTYDNSGFSPTYGQRLLLV